MTLVSGNIRFTYHHKYAPSWSAASTTFLREELFSINQSINHLFENTGSKR